MLGNRKSLVIWVVLCLLSLAAAIGWSQTQPARRIRERKKGQGLGDRKPAVAKATTKYNDKATTFVKAAADNVKKNVEEKPAKEMENKGIKLEKLPSITEETGKK